MLVGMSSSGRPTRVSAADARRRRIELAATTFETQDGVASRRQLYAAGLRRWDVVAEIRAGRWTRRGPQTISRQSGELRLPAVWWVALHEVGAASALDGVTALQAAGLTRFEDDLLHISVPKSSTPQKFQGVRVHETRRRRPDDLEAGGVRRVRPPVAAIRGALWARSDRQAALILVMGVQQGLATPQQLAEELAKVKRHRRRRILGAIIADLSNGVRSLGELDFARICRAEGLPEPDRQSVRRLAHGTAYLDVEWTAYGVVVEIDGIHHAEPAQLVNDALRQNEVSRAGALVLRVPVVGLRTERGRFIQQIRAALLSRGWSPNPSLASAEAESS